jgi:hypothetical protein
LIAAGDESQRRAKHKSGQDEKEQTQNTGSANGSKALKGSSQKQKKNTIKTRENTNKSRTTQELQKKAGTCDSLLGGIIQVLGAQKLQATF